MGKRSPHLVNLAYYFHLGGWKYPIHIMHEELRGRDLTQLCDLLVEKTMQLLKVMEQKSSPVRIHELKREVEQIQFAIKDKKANGEQ